jgi:hypothetical protein
MNWPLSVDRLEFTFVRFWPKISAAHAPFATPAEAP